MNFGAPKLSRLYVPTAAVITMLAVGFAAKAVGLRINVTPSLPDALYIISKSPGRGDVVSFCPPVIVPTLVDDASGKCGGKLPLIKRVAAVAGDRVEVKDDGVYVNGERIPNSMPLERDSIGRSLPRLRGAWMLGAGEIWVAGEHPQSFDSRYFGPISTSALL